MQLTLVSLASLLAVFGNIPYIRDTFRAKITPHPVTWFLWSIVSMVTFFGAWQKGGGLGVIPILVSEAFTLVIFFLSIRIALKNGFEHIRRTDLIYLTTALLGLIPWCLTNDPTLSVITVVGIDCIAFIPTLTKAARHPGSENVILFASNVLRHILILFSLDAINTATSLHSVAMILTNSIMVYLLTFHTKRI